VEVKSQEFTFFVPLMSKKRPRIVFGKKAYMPKAYMEWRKNLAALMKEQWTEEPLEKVLDIQFGFVGPARSDADNLIGAVFDTGNGIIWKDDRVKILPKGSWTWKKAKQKDSFIHLKVFY
tara:strand:+ start:60 stop:419 length:360 start_codon:yes stop_codon:yes gene_type:complete